MWVYFEQLGAPEWLAKLLALADNILFTFYFLFIGYLLIFAIGSVIKKSRIYPTAKKQYRYLVLLYVRKDDLQVVDSVNSLITKQDYSNYEAVIVTNALFESVNRQLESLPIRLMPAETDSYNKAWAMRYAVSNLSTEVYDAVVILDADGEVKSDFLSCINNAYYMGGMAIQVHCLAKNLDSDTALFGAVSEEINNSIFRLGHVNFGLSSALIGSGMVFNFDWFKKNIADITNDDLEKQLETKLLEQSILIEYLNDVKVYGEMAAKAEEFYQERSTWMTNKANNAMTILKKFPSSLMQGNYDYCNKLFQWLIPSRMIIIGTLFIIAVTLMILIWPISIKWWVLFFTLTVTFSLALPDYLIDARFVKAFRGAPILFIITVFNSFKRKLSFKK